MEVRTCKVCQVDISTRKVDAKYCSRICYNKMLSEQYKAQIKALIKETTCLQCNKVFMPKTRQVTKFCSRVCMQVYISLQNSGDRSPRDCENCGETFTPRRAFAVFCSPRCRNQTTVLKRSLNMSAAEFRAVHPQVTPEQRAAQLFPQNESLQLPSGVIIRPDDSLNPCAKCTVRKVRSINDDYCLPCIKEQGLE